MLLPAVGRQSKRRHPDHSCWHWQSEKSHHDHGAFCPEVGACPTTCWTWKAHAAWQFKSMMGMSFAWMWLSPPYSFMICFLKSLGSANRTVCWHNWVCLHTSKVLPLSLRLSLSFLPSPAKFWSLAAKTLLHLHPVGLQASVIDMHGTLLHGIVRHGRFLNGIECIKWAVSFHLDLRVHGSP